MTGRCSAAKLATLLFLAGCAGTTMPNPAADGPPDTTGPVSDKVINGVDEPGMPAVGLFVKDGQNWCTGTVIDAEWVLTAAHCFAEFAGNESFGIGASMGAFVEQAQVVEAYVHPQYDGQTIDNDVAVATATPAVRRSSPGPTASWSWPASPLTVISSASSSASTPASTPSSTTSRA